MNNQPLTTGDEPSLSGAQPTDRQLEPGLGGEAALTHLIETIHHEDLSVRCRAVEQLETIGSERAIDLLEQVTDDPNAYVRMRAIKALGKTRSERAVDILLNKFQSETDLQARSQVIRSLGETGSERAVDPLTQTFRSDEQVLDRSDAALALGQIGSPKAVEALSQALLDRSITRHTAGWAIRQIGENHPDAIQPILDQFMKTLFGPPGQDRSRAIHVLAAVRPAGLASQLLEAMKDPERPPQQCIAAVLTLRALGDKRFTKPLLELLPTAQNGQLRYWVEKTLMDIRVREDIPAIIDLLKHEDWRVRRSAVRILGRRDARSAVPHIINFLEDDRAPLRKEAADALRRLYRAENISQAVESLIHALGDRGKTVREAAARALGRMHRADNISLAIEPLIHTLSDPADTVREAASLALGRMDDPDVVHTLITFFQNSDDVHERRAAIGALYYLQYRLLRTFEGDVLRVIQSAVNATDTEVARTAHIILERLARWRRSYRSIAAHTNE